MQYLTSAALLLCLALLAACSNEAQSPASGDHAGNQSWSGAFAYCQAVGTIDSPDARYTGPPSPPAVVRGLAQAMGASADAATSRVFRKATFWRCMDGAVYACNVGANLPCQTKADTNRTPTTAEREYCRDNPQQSYIPMAVTGHATVLSWRCEKAKAVAGKQLSTVDARGYASNIWYRIARPVGAAGS